MQLKNYNAAEEFWDVASAFLLSNEAENNLMISIVRSLVDDPKRYDKPYFVAGKDDAGRVGAVAIMTPPHNVLLGRCEEGFMTQVVRKLGERMKTVPGVVAPDDVPARFCKVVEARIGRRAEKAMSMRTYKLTAVEDVPLAAGRFEPAEAADREKLARMIAGFEHDAHTTTHTQAQEQADGLVANGQLYVWRDENGGIVSMAGKAAGDTPNGQRVGWVYTPPHQRGRGYATSVVAMLSRQILQDGKSFCFLFTDLSNPTSNKIYRQIGYRPVCDFNDYRFIDGGEGKP